MASSPTHIHLPGNHLEGGGQLLRLAVCLSALTGTAVSIDHIRGNRRGAGGLKPQHLHAVRWLAQACGATTSGAEPKSQTLHFKPGSGHPAPRWWTTKPLSGGRSLRQVRIEQATPGSVGLVLQAVLPFILFSSCFSVPDAEAVTPVELTITGGTHVTNSPSYEYIAEVLLPMLAAIGVPPISASCSRRGWSTGFACVGSATFVITPLPRGQALPGFALVGRRGEAGQRVVRIQVFLLVPQEVLRQAREQAVEAIETKFPGVAVGVGMAEPSGHAKRLYLLLVAHTADGHRRAFDGLYERKITDVRAAATELVGMVTAGLARELAHDSVVDEFLQDQLVVFQALARGRSEVRASRTVGGVELEEESTEERTPSLHTVTARWVAGEMLGVEMRQDGSGEGIGFVVGEGVEKAAVRQEGGFEEAVGRLSLERERCD